MCQILEKFALCGVFNYFRKGVKNSTGVWHQTLLILDKEELQVIRSRWSERREQKQFAPFAFRDAAKSDASTVQPHSYLPCWDTEAREKGDSLFQASQLVGLLCALFFLGIPCSRHAQMAPTAGDAPRIRGTSGHTGYRQLFSMDLALST